MKERIKLFAFLMAFWMLLTFEINSYVMLFGVLFSMITTIFSFKLLEENKVVFPKLSVVIKYTFYLIKEILVSSFMHIRRILSNEEERIAVIDLGFKNQNRFVLVLMANFITLTPGTLALDVEEDKIKILAIESSLRQREDIEKGIYEIFYKIFK